MIRPIQRFNDHGEIDLPVAYDTLRRTLADPDTGQLPNLMPIVADLEIRWGRSEVWSNEAQKMLTPDAAAEIEWSYRPEGWEPK